MTRIILALLFCYSAFAQAIFTPGVPPNSAPVPAKLVATAGTGANGTTCTITGDTFPATKLTFNCTVGGIANFISGTLPFPAAAPFMALTIQLNSDPNVQTLMLYLVPGASGIAAQVSVNGGAPVTGTF
jgi:hypothetical protein